jgi:hypothetical protein
MGYLAELKKIEARQRREERAALREQREFARQVKEMQKLSEMEQARLMVASHLNQIEVLRSMHREASPSFDWASCAFALPPPLIPSPPKWRHLIEFHGTVHGFDNEQPMPPPPSWLPGSPQAADNLDAADEAIAKSSHALQMDEWQNLRSLGRRILAGEPASYTTALAEYSNLSELGALGSEIHFTVHEPGVLEFTMSASDRSCVPEESMSLTASGKLSFKAMPKKLYHEIYQDYVCGAVLRIAREVFALLPVHTILAHATVTLANKINSSQRQTLVLSALLDRNRMNSIDFTSADASDTVETFPHSGSVKASRSTGEFIEVKPMALPATPNPCGIDSMIMRIAKAKADIEAARSHIPRTRSATTAEPSLIQ